MAKICLRSDHGFLLSAQLDGSVIADRNYPTPGPWEEWDVEKLLVAPDRPAVALKSHHGGYLSAEGGGGSKVAANRYYATPGPWETWFHILQPDGRHAFQSWDGKHYLCADGPAGAVTA